LCIVHVVGISSLIYILLAMIFYMYI